MPQYGNPIDMGRLPINNVGLQQLASDPGTPFEGQYWENTTTHVMKAYLNGTVVTFSSGGGVANAYTSIIAGGTATAISSDSITFSSANDRLTVVATNAGAGADTCVWTLVEANINHNALANLTTGDVHTHYTLNAGRAGGQTLRGGTGASDNLTLSSTSNGTKGTVNVGLAAFNETTGVATINGKLSNVTDPAANQDAVTLAYLNNAIQGIYFEPVNYATTTTLPANTYANGASGVGATLTGTANGALAAIDGQTPVLNDIILVKNEAAPANNGIYKLTQVGTGGTPYILTRDVRMDQSAEVGGTTVVVETGTTNSGSLWYTGVNAPTMGTTSITFTQMNKGTDIQGSASITITGNVITINSTWVGQTAITTLGTIATGTWQATAIALAYGGLGLDISSGSGATTGRDSTHLGRQTTAPATATNVTVAAAGIATMAIFTLTHTGAATAFTCTHNMNNSNPHVSIQDASGNMVIVDWQATNANTVVVTWAVAQPNTTVFKVTIIG